ncbi:hypothetical protein PENTCL1PPCAC_18920, partial [Pristionchus entomophagus]
DFFISIELERALSTGLLIHFIIASLLNSLAFYCLLRETPPNQHAVRFYLLGIQVILFIFDLEMDILLEPISLLPIPAAYFIGLLPRAGVPLPWLIAIFLNVVTTLGMFIIFCLLHKHQTIIDDSSHFKLNRV